VVPHFTHSQPMIGSPSLLPFVLIVVQDVEALTIVGWLLVVNEWQIGRGSPGSTLACLHLFVPGAYFDNALFQTTHTHRGRLSVYH